ncbi:MAG: ABC transporter permease [Lentisphaeria bacterium]|jgi:peptide/nickel transport system permease protein
MSNGADTPRARLWRALKRRPAALAALALVAAYLALAAGSWATLAAARLAGREPLTERQELDARLQPPSARHWFGTDYLGRDVFWRTLAGAKTAVTVGLLAGGISLAVGVTLGALGGTFGGRTDAVVMWLYSTFAAMPTLLFILAFALLIGRGIGAVYIGIGLTSWVGLCRVIRAECLRLRDLPYIQAARSQGIPPLRILWRHLLPNTFHLIIVFFALRFSTAVMTEVIVSFLGLGVQLEPSWGVMIAEGKERLWQGAWWEMAAATAAISGLVLALNLLGDSLRDLLDPHLAESV